MPYIANDSVVVVESTQSTISDSSTIDEDAVEKSQLHAYDKTSIVAWFELAALCGLASSCSLMWLSFSVVSDISVKWLDVDMTGVNWLGNATALMYIFTSLITGWFFERFGVKRSVSRERILLDLKFRTFIFPGSDITTILALDWCIIKHGRKLVQSIICIVPCRSSISCGDARTGNSVDYCTLSTKANPTID
jgi:hypothetical protein